MRYGILSDIHGNLEALLAVHSAMDRLGVETKVFLGDVVGYGADANECVERVYDLADARIRGNHDRIVSGIGDIDQYEYASADVRTADLWSRSALTPGNLVRDLPSGPKVMDGPFVVCHGSPLDEDEYLFSWGAVRDSLGLLRAQFGGGGACFFGHTHVPVVIEGGKRTLEEETVQLEEGVWYLVNPGSVGQPRDGDPRASFGVFDTGRRLYAHYRVHYDIRAAQRKILEARLPPTFAYRLSAGR